MPSIEYRGHVTLPVVPATTYKIIIEVDDLEQAEKVTESIEGWVFEYYDTPPNMYIMNRTDERINRRLEGSGRNVRWTHWVTNDGLECNDTLCTMHRRELCDQFAGVTSKPQLEDENFGCNDCEGDKAYD
tara:strand:- start:559 stop:948 length:390 start_codon:yes stop_codon:yes gene_type:complete